MKKKLKLKRNVKYMLITVVIGLIIYGINEYATSTTLPALPENYDYQWVEVSCTEFTKGEDAYNWVCAEYPETKTLDFSRWMKIVESKNITQSMADNLFYSTDDIFLKSTVNLYVVDLR